MKRGRLQTIFFAMMLVVTLCTSCNIYEDNSSCPMYVNFKYDYNMSFKDFFGQQCDKIELFVFNADGLLIQSITEEGNRLSQEGYQIPIHLNPGSYTLMAWGGAKESYTIEGAIPNVSSTKEMVLKLNHINHISNHSIEPLWNGTPLSFTIVEAYQHHETINLVKNTNRINVNIYTKEVSLSKEDIAIEIQANNSAYSYNNESISLDNYAISYQPFDAKSVAENHLVYSIDMLRILEDIPIWLTAINKSSGQSILPDAKVNLTELFRKSKPSEMTTQEYFDRQDSWNFNLYLEENMITILIQVNGWTVWSQDDEL